MSLRTRLLLGLVGAFLVFLVAAVFAVGAQRNQLYDQLDAQLLGTPVPRGAAGSGPGSEGGPGPAEPSIESISRLYVARIEPDGVVVPVIEGAQLTDSPDVTELLEDPPADRALLTLSGQGGISDFRALYIAKPQPGVPPTIVALSLDNVEATAQQLIMIFVGVAVLMALALGLVAYWVNRFGINPITRMTSTAEAIAAGDRERRAEHYGTNTEAGRLADAFNIMLDERDEAENRLRMFVSNASHELRTPLTSIQGYLDLYTEGGFREEGQLDDAIRRMRAESARMNLLVEDLLLLAKLDEQQALDVGSVELATMLDDVAASALAARPGRTIEVTLEPENGVAVVADPLRLQQAVAILVDNAFTHTPNDTEVRLAARRGDSTVTIVVSDDGPGIPAELIDTVFDRFQRADDSRSRHSGGSGLGLAIAKAIVEAHGGTIAAASTVGQGATFTIELSASATASAPGEVPAYSPLATNSSSQGGSSSPDSPFMIKPRST